MFGAGMFAAGRVEEAFRELEAEYITMDESSKALIISQPQTTITGINENNRTYRSTFREAVGRFNYLAERVPDSIGLNTSINNEFSWLTVFYLFLVVLGFTSLTIIIYQRKQR
jgi:hypothetical protein